MFHKNHFGHGHRHMRGDWAGRRGEPGFRHMHGGRGGRGRVFDQGDLRLVLLGLIAEKPRHGYEIIKEIEDRLGGAYSPSPGVIYPDPHPARRAGLRPRRRRRRQEALRHHARGRGSTRRQQDGG